jgi:hypothetical protein
MNAMPVPPELPPDGKTKIGDKVNIPRSAMKSVTMESVLPIYNSNINNDHIWTFGVKSRAEEFVRFNAESLSMVLFGTYTNPTYEAGHATPEKAAPNHALRAKSNLPSMFLVPTVMGAGFFSKVEVHINGLRVATNDGLGIHQQHYAHCARTYCRKPPGPILATNKDIASTSAADKTAGMLEASKPFDYESWDASTGVRIPAYLDGIYPFDTKNKTRASTDHEEAEANYFPPGTDFVFKFYLNNSKSQSIFHLGGCTMRNYFSSTENGTAEAYNLTFQNVELSYESVQLKAKDHLAIMAKLSNTILTFPYDIVNVQYGNLQEGASYTENKFQIEPHASIIYVLFLKSWQVNFMQAKRKPVSAFSRFPNHCTRMTASFANEQHLVLKEMRDFGQRPVKSTDISLFNFFKFQKERGLFPGSFDNLFPGEEGTDSYVQTLVTDLSSLSSNRTEYLTLQCHFSGANKSDADNMLMVITVHPTGVATCKQSTFWEFKNVV